MGYDLERGRLDLTHHPFCTKFSARRRAHHHARQRERSRRRAVLDAARGRPRDVRAGRRAPRSKARRSATACRPACTRASRGCGKTWSRAAAASGSIFIRSCSEAFPDQLGARAARDVSSRDQQGRALADPHRRRRGDLQSARHAAVRSRAANARGQAARARICRRPGAPRCRQNLGVAPPDDRDGCLQDVHWYCGGIGGGFQSYTIGNILARSSMRRR